MRMWEITDWAAMICGVRYLVYEYYIKDVLPRHTWSNVLKKHMRPLHLPILLNW
jgi:hypothetical protein